MKRARSRTLTIVATAVLFAIIPVSDRGLKAQSFSPYVDERGNITIPDDFRSWQFLGTWGVAEEEDDQVGSTSFHNVYTQRETIEAFRSTGKFPDGAVLVKELLRANTNSMTTGEISYATETEGWFIMIKDTQGRFKDNKLWGGGWGWALFNADEPKTTVTENYETDCISCHIPAKKDDWIYLRGYPALR
jgi:hypothetical protein